MRRSARVVPDPEEKSLHKHLESAGVHDPLYVASRLEEEEFTRFSELLSLTSDELKELLNNVLQLKFKSSSRLQKYCADALSCRVV